jgi:hypothetical protein
VKQRSNKVGVTESPSAAAEAPEVLIAGGGEMGERIRTFDWSDTGGGFD